MCVVFPSSLLFICSVCSGQVCICFCCFDFGCDRLLIVSTPVLLLLHWNSATLHIPLTVKFLLLLILHYCNRNMPHYIDTNTHANLFAAKLSKIYESCAWPSNQHDQISMAKCIAAKTFKYKHNSLMFASVAECKNIWRDKHLKCAVWMPWTRYSCIEYVHNFALDSTRIHDGVKKFTTFTDNDKLFKATQRFN